MLSLKYIYTFGEFQEAIYEIHHKQYFRYGGGVACYIRSYWSYIILSVYRNFIT